MSTSEDSHFIYVDIRYLSVFLSCSFCPELSGKAWIIYTITPSIVYSNSVSHRSFLFYF